MSFAAPRTQVPCLASMAQNTADEHEIMRGVYHDVGHEQELYETVCDSMGNFSEKIKSFCPLL